MFHKVTIAALIVALSLFSFAQNPAQPQPQVATTLTFPLINPPVSPPTLNIAISGAPGPSSSTVFYWLVAEFPIGNSSPSGPFQAFNVPTTLSGGNFEILNWPPVAGATGYDVLKTTTPVPPTGACACAVVINTASTTVNDQSNSTSAYTLNTFPLTSAQIVLDNEGSGALGVSIPTARQGGALLQVPDGMYNLMPADCAMFTTAGAFAANTGGSGGLTGPAVVRIAANNWVLQGITTAVANSIAVECDINPPARITAGRGVKITSIQLLYGVQTTALTSITAPTLSTVTYPATGGAAAATVGTLAGGTLTVTPGTLQLATTTSGQCYSENIALGTPIILNTTNQRLTLEQIFNQTAAAATQLQICGAVVYYTSIPL